MNGESCLLFDPANFTVLGSGFHNPQYRDELLQRVPGRRLDTRPLRRQHYTCQSARSLGPLCNVMTPPILLYGGRLSGPRAATPSGQAVVTAA